MLYSEYTLSGRVLLNRYIYYTWYKTGCPPFSFQFNVLARDQSSPERTATATVIVNIRRSNFPPVFVNTPYFTGVNVGSAIGSTIYTVTATDGDLLVSITLCIF